MLKSIFEKAGLMNIQAPGKLGLIISAPVVIALSYVPAFQRAVLGVWNQIAPVTNGDAPELFTSSCLVLIVGAMAAEMAVGGARRLGQRQP